VYFKNSVTSINAINAVLLWVKASIGQVSTNAAKLIGAAAETAGEVSMGEFFSVAVLALGPGEWVACCAAIGLAAFTVFEAVRCAQEAMDG
jgi:hypothetical protein